MPGHIDFCLLNSTPKLNQNPKYYYSPEPLQVYVLYHDSKLDQKSSSQSKSKKIF